MGLSYVIFVIITLPIAFSWMPNTLRRFNSSGNRINSGAIEFLSGKNAIVTGSSSGLGRAIATQLARCNLKSIVLSGRNLEALEEVKKECLSICPALEIFIMTCDLAESESAEKFARDAVCVLEGNVDLLVLSGGCSSRSSFLDTSLDVDKMLMNVNFLASAAICKGVVPSMVRRNSGSIIWISSIQGLIGTPFRTSYAASKFAVQGYCESLRSELSSSGVKVQCVSPGYINTNLSKSAITGDGSKYGVTDETTANGAEPNHVAVDIINSARTNKMDYIVAADLSARVALLLKVLSPRVLEKQLVKRYKIGSEKKNK
jgi:dehydrogenase/reductase SDR family protein 7B